VARVGGEPEIWGLPASITVTEKLVRVLLARPSLAVIEISVWVPRWATEGVPASAPVAPSNCNHEGLPCIVKVRGSPSGSDADGWKL
jgi:hypothetical protein